MRWLDGITDSMDVGFKHAPEDGKGQGSLPATVHGVAKSWTCLSD